MGGSFLSPASREPSYAEQERTQQDFGTQQTILAGEDANADRVYLEQQNERADLLRWQQDMSNDLIILKYRLENKELVGEDWKPIQRILRQSDGTTKTVNAPQLINAEGIQMIIQEVDPLLSRNMMMTDFREERILGILKNTIYTIINNMTDNYYKYEFDSDNADHIVRLIANTITPAPFRAKDGAERKISSTINKRVESHHSRPEYAQKKKIFGFI